jgi:SSS family solute:Na+ symporter
MTESSIHLGVVDYAILLIYFIFVLGIGFALKRTMKGSKDFFLSGRSIPTWIAGLAFLSAGILSFIGLVCAVIH